jgi:hypothetical protein
MIHVVMTMSYDDDGNDEEKKIMDIKIEAETDVELKQEAFDATFLSEILKHEVSLSCAPYKTFSRKC